VETVLEMKMKGWGVRGRLSSRLERGVFIVVLYWRIEVPDGVFLPSGSVFDRYGWTVFLHLMFLHSGTLHCTISVEFEVSGFTGTGCRSFMLY